MFLNKYFWTSVAGLFFFLSSCTTVPITGRKQLDLIPKADLISMSFSNYQQVLKESKLSSDPIINSKVTAVGDRIAVAAESFLHDYNRSDDLKYYKWEFRVINDDKVINAWCMPGGKVAVYTGICRLLRMITA